MKTTDTISVNPGKTTLGQTHEEVLKNLFRNQVLTDTHCNHGLDALVSVIFPSTKTGLTHYRNYAIPMRAVFAAILIVAGLSMIQNSAQFDGSFAIGLVQMIFGGFIAIGFLTRPSMFLAAGYFAVMSALSLRTGMVDLTSFSLMFGCMVMCIIGSGKYSADSLIRRQLIRKSRNNKTMTLDYKAFRNVRF